MCINTVSLVNRSLLVSPLPKGELRGVNAVHNENDCSNIVLQ